jgi:hypothetical protein
MSKLTAEKAAESADLSLLESDGNYNLEEKNLRKRPSEQVFILKLKYLLFMYFTIKYKL